MPRCGHAGFYMLSSRYTLLRPNDVSAGFTNIQIIVICGIVFRVVD